MKEQVNDMKAAGAETEQLDIEHVRQPGQWVPIAVMECRESPADVFPGHAALNDLIGTDVSRIVVVYEAGVPYAGERQECACAEKEGDKRRDVPLGIHVKVGGMFAQGKCERRAFPRETRTLMWCWREYSVC